MSDAIMTARLIYMLIACHMMGDYVLQIDFIAKTKGDNVWHMLAHCILYTVPFAVVFGIDWRVTTLLGTHILIDEMKANGRMSYVIDQMLHLLVLTIYLIWR